MTGASAEIVLADAGWLKDPATTAVLDALEAAGGRGCVRFVGGCVRNAVMGRAIADIMSGRRPDLDFAFTGMGQAEQAPKLSTVPES